LLAPGQPSGGLDTRRSMRPHRTPVMARAVLTPLLLLQTDGMSCEALPAQACVLLLLL
jgi:hypothetical protein